MIIFSIFNKKRNCKQFLNLPYWGEIWGSNPCIPEPQSGVLTTSPIPPSLNKTSLFYYITIKKVKYFLKNSYSPILFLTTIMMAVWTTTSIISTTTEYYD